MSFVALTTLFHFAGSVGVWFVLLFQRRRISRSFSPYIIWILSLPIKRKLIFTLQVVSINANATYSCCHPCWVRSPFKCICHSMWQTCNPQFVRFLFCVFSCYHSVLNAKIYPQNTNTLNCKYMFAEHSQIEVIRLMDPGSFHTANTNCILFFLDILSFYILGLLEGLPPQTFMVLCAMTIKISLYLQIVSHICKSLQR